MRPIRAIALLALHVTLAGSASAQSADAPAGTLAERKPISFGFSVNTIAIDELVARGQHVGARAWGLQADAGITFARWLYAGLDAGAHRLSDDAGFTQATTLGDKSSSAALMYFSGMAGLRTPGVQLVPGLPAASLGVYGGQSFTAGERSISDCVDCTSEGIDIAGGTFVQPTLLVGDGNARFRLSGRFFSGGKGIRNVLSAGMELGGR